jgi:hypothetical protein
MKVGSDIPPVPYWGEIDMNTEDIRFMADSPTTRNQSAANEITGHVLSLEEDAFHEFSSPINTGSIRMAKVFRKLFLQF